LRVTSRGLGDVYKRQVNKAREQLRKQVSVLALAGAEKLVRREINSSTHQALLDELAAEI
jgi:F-type H+-transporting ATPase subunit b